MYESFFQPLMREALPAALQQLMHDERQAQVRQHCIGVWQVAAAAHARQAAGTDVNPNMPPPHVVILTGPSATPVLPTCLLLGVASLTVASTSPSCVQLLGPQTHKEVQEIRRALYQ